MITEDYVSYEVAKLLNEKGFEILTDKVYDNQNKLDYQNVVCWLEKRLPYISAPTHQMVMKWLREEKKIYIRIIEDAFGENYHFEIYSKNPNIKMNYYVPNYYESTYEDAVESALKYVLVNLI